MPLSATLTHASAVDLDVRRLPNRIIAAAGVWTVAVLLLRAIVDDQPRTVIQAAAAGVAGAVLFLVLHLVGGGSLGFGDVKLVAVLAAAAAGTAGWATVLALILLGCLIALIGMAARRQRDIAFGPCLALASVITVGAAMRSF